MPRHRKQTMKTNDLLRSFFSPHEAPPPPPPLPDGDGDAEEQEYEEEEGGDGDGDRDGDGDLLCRGDLNGKDVDVASRVASFPTYTLLSGPPRSGKTSLLFQFAYNSSAAAMMSEASADVVFICKRQDIERKPPILPHDVAVSSEAFERVRMKYVEDDEDIRKYFAAFHMHHKMPRVVIIDDFLELFDDRKCKKLFGQSKGREIAIMRTLALCRDAIDHANGISGAFCKVILSDTHTGQGPRLLYLYQRWISTILTIEAIDSSFMLKSFRNKEKSERGMPYAIYTLAQQNLKLEAMGMSL